MESATAACNSTKWYPGPSGMEVRVDGSGRVVATKLPNELVKRLEAAAEQTKRSKSWIVRQALSEWLAEQERRHRLTVAAMASIDAGEGLTDHEAMAHFAASREARPQKSGSQ